MDSIKRQVSTYMQGSEFGDSQLKNTMAAELEQRLRVAESEARSLRVYCGYDVTAPDIHLGHTITMRKLRQFQDFGHNVSFVVGTFTTLIGDPSDRDKARAIVSLEKIKGNAKSYADQALRILDRQRTAIRYNDEWLAALTFRDVIEAASLFTVQQFLIRDRLQSRIQKNEPLYLSELLYPLAQGFDSVFLKADVQIGATEQLFNLMACRRIQEAHGLKPQICITYPLLTGLDGKMKMSKSLGNYIGIAEEPDEQYGKVMSLRDELLNQYFELVTRWPPEQVAELEDALRTGRLHPMQAKKKLAWEIVASFHGDVAADNAARTFERVHQGDGVPEEIPVLEISKETTIIEALVEAGLCTSKSDARRAVAEKSIRIDGSLVEETGFVVQPREAILQRGRRRFVRLVPSR